MIKDIFNIYNSDSSLGEGFSNFLQKQVLKGKERNTIALSGGSTPKIVFDYWSKNCGDILPWENMYFFWGDERCVVPENKMSNYGMTKKHLFDHISLPSDNIFRIHGENESYEEAAWYSSVLDNQLEKRNGLPFFDLVMLGLGDDGHTLSIFPYQINLWNSKEYCFVTKHPESGKERISITGSIVNNSRYVAFLVTGKNKAQRVRDIIRDRKRSTDLYPAARVSPVSQQVYWFLDEAAASLL